MLEVKTGRAGHFLAEKGKEFVNLISTLILKHGKCEQVVFPSKQHYYLVLTSNKKNLGQSKVIIKPSWKLRDIHYGVQDLTRKTQP